MDIIAILGAKLRGKPDPNVDIISNLFGMKKSNTTPSFIEMFNFKESMTGVNGSVAVLNGTGGSRDSDGLKISAKSAWCSIPTDLFGANRTYKLQFGTCSKNNPWNWCFCRNVPNSTANFGFEFDLNSNKWALYNMDTGQRVKSSLDFNAISNKTIFIYVDDTGKWNLYIDGVLVISSSAWTLTDCTRFTIGSSGSLSVASMIIESLTVYEGLVIT